MLASQTRLTHTCIEGSFVRISPDEISVADYPSYKLIHRVGSPFIKSPWYQNQDPCQHSDSTSGLFCIRGRQEAIQRRKLFQQAGKPSVVREWEPFIVDIIARTIAKIKRDAASDKADLAMWWNIMTVDVLGKIAFGKSFNAVENEKEGRRTQCFPVTRTNGSSRKHQS